MFGHSSGFFFDTFFPHWKTNSFNGSMILNNNDPSMIRLKGERNEIKILLKTIVINFFSSLWSIQFIYKVSGQPPTFNNNKKQFIPVNLHRKQRRVDLKFSVDEKIIDKEQNEKKNLGVNIIIIKMTSCTWLVNITVAVHIIISTYSSSWSVFFIHFSYFFLNIYLLYHGSASWWWAINATIFTTCKLMMMMMMIM